MSEFQRPQTWSRSTQDTEVCRVPVRVLVCASGCVQLTGGVLNKSQTRSTCCTTTGHRCRTQKHTHPCTSIYVRTVSQSFEDVINKYKYFSPQYVVNTRVQTHKKTHQLLFNWNLFLLFKMINPEYFLGPGVKVMWRDMVPWCSATSTLRRKHFQQRVASVNLTFVNNGGRSQNNAVSWSSELI